MGDVFVCKPHERALMHRMSDFGGFTARPGGAGVAMDLSSLSDSSPGTLLPGQLELSHTSSYNVSLKSLKIKQISV